MPDKAWGRGDAGLSGEALPLLSEGLSQLGVPFAAEQFNKLRVFLEELERWNRKYGFVALSDQAGRRELIVRHVLDSLSAWPTVSALVHRKHIADVGSGAGFPGIPLAVFLPDSRFTLIEPSARKTAFLQNVAILARLENIEIAEARLEAVETRFDLVVFRAFSPLSRELPALLRILEPGGLLIAYKGKRARVLEELAAVDLDPQRVRIVAVQVPYLEEERHLVVVSTTSSAS
ncbi:MAG: 16S rRNA (guanine(527)-N(7))-methyltransferase RsmG [Spirochaetaceae bacterium]|nr:MAG: 16S rRNA (guanine(527)-N(7))-methyltransferase RsmG [Spirochaetaceae bacterium]